MLSYNEDIALHSLLMCVHLCVCVCVFERTMSEGII